MEYEYYKEWEIQKWILHGLSCTIMKFTQSFRQKYNLCVFYFHEKFQHLKFLNWDFLRFGVKDATIPVTLHQLDHNYRHWGCSGTSTVPIVMPCNTTFINSFPKSVVKLDKKKKFRPIEILWIECCKNLASFKAHFQTDSCSFKSLFTFG